MVLSFGALYWQLGNLKTYYLAQAPAPGGTYIEGLVGETSIINPLFPESDASTAVSNLVFNGLFIHDNQGKLVPRLAESYSVSDDGLTYGVSLRRDVYWQDKEPFTAKDVAFTYRMIKHPDVRSPLRSDWKDIDVQAVDDYTVNFVLPNRYTPFPNFLTVGIVPEHLLSKYEPSQLRLNNFNQKPVGTGPFMVNNYTPNRKQIELVANQNYFLGQPKLNQFIIKLYENYDDALDAFRKTEINGMEMSTQQLGDARTIEESKIHSSLLSTQTYAFFNTQKGHLKDTNVRKALVQSVSPQKAAGVLDYSYKPARSALLQEHFHYGADFDQLPYNLEEAKKHLEAAGFQKNGDYYTKDNQPLTLHLVALDSPEYSRVADYLVGAWKQLGVKVEAQKVPLEVLKNSFMLTRNYDILLFGVKLGADPDVYAYWHSSQAQNKGLNLSSYKSDIADEALEAGRTRTDKQLRKAKYETFLQTWKADAPAVALYRFRYYYLTRKKASGILPGDVLVDKQERYFNVQDWTVNTKEAYKKNLN